MFRVVDVTRTTDLWCWKRPLYQLSNHQLSHKVSFWKIFLNLNLLNFSNLFNRTKVLSCHLHIYIISYLQLRILSGKGKEIIFHFQFLHQRKGFCLGGKLHKMEMNEFTAWLYCTWLYCTMYMVVLYNCTWLNWTWLYCTKYMVLLYIVVQYRVVFYMVVLYMVVLYIVVLYCTWLYI